MIATLAGVAEAVFAGGLESLVMPGPVIADHAKHEAGCSQCHQPFSKDSQDQLCRDCHEKVDADMRNKQGLHGNGMAGDMECKHCHTDHEGREADIIQFDMEVFDHDSTDYPLEGGHLLLQCNACHTSSRKYRDTPHNCIDCHRDEDLHQGLLGETCSNCHNVNTWHNNDFEHGKTNFPLRGKHAEVACNTCHIDQQYKDTTADCFGCHRLNDAHARRYGTKCGECHAERGWDYIHFDHDRDTEYPLDGRHDKVHCDACHTGILHEMPPATECVDCHDRDDEHQGRYGRDCGACHKPQGWSEASFEHDGKTRFPLRGRHQEIECGACHRGNVFTESLQTQCYSCHRPDDVHQGEQGKLCTACHDAAGWNKNIRFDHDMVRFPLIGLHAVTSCDECHPSAVFRTAASDCNSCHRTDDVHELRLGTHCESCHNPNAWSLWEFDHDTRTEYPLDGAHEDIGCLGCHDQPAPQGIGLSTSCAACHRADDAHDGQFGSFCGRCHRTESFNTVEIR